MLLLLFITTGLITGFSTIDVKLFIPKLVQQGSSPTLICYYELEGTPLYSVKWYRGNYEFYRYVPQEVPQFTAFPFPGIIVDMSRSNATQVTLKNVPKYIGGNISCEVSVEETFITATDFSNLIITDINLKAPYLNVSSYRLFQNEKLIVICSAEKNDPPPLITFYVNNNKVNRFMIKSTGNGEAVLNTSVLFGYVEMNKDYVSPIWLRCDSYLRGVYHLSSRSIPIIPQLLKDHFSSTDKLYLHNHLIFLIIGIYYVYYL